MAKASALLALGIVSIFQVASADQMAVFKNVISNLVVSTTSSRLIGYKKEHITPLLKNYALRSTRDNPPSQMNISRSGSNS